MYAAIRNAKVSTWLILSMVLIYKKNVLQAENKENFTRQGSLRRVLPPEHNKDNVFGRQHEDLNRSYKKFYQEYAVLAE